MMCAELGGPRGRWPLQWRGEGWVGRASEEETVPYGGRLGTGDFDSGAEEGSLPRTELELGAVGSGQCRETSFRLSRVRGLDGKVTAQNVAFSLTQCLLLGFLLAGS